MILPGRNIPDWLTNHRSFRILLLLNGQPIKCTDLGLFKEYPFHVADFNWSSSEATI